MKFRRWLRLKTLRLMRLKGDPDLIAKGIAIGVSVDFLPTFGLGALFAYLFATIWKVNRIAAVITALILKCLIIPFYGANVIVGRLFFGQPSADVRMTDMPFFSLESIKLMGNSFILGSCINALVCGVAAFFISRYFIRLRRARKKKCLSAQRVIQEHEQP